MDCTLLFKTISEVLEKLLLLLTAHTLCGKTKVVFP
jgi:hypothetical protein